ncbi:MAG: hypothetical protein QM831_32430 [Kofleriaceae bacterium]
MERKIAVTQVNASGSHLGYLGCLHDTGSAVFACGGTYHKATILRSDDRGASWRVMPKVSVGGLREMLQVGDRLFVVGETGYIGVSTDGAETFTNLTTGTSACLYRITQHDGKLWVCADGGLLLMSSDGGRTFQKVQTTGSGRILDIFVVDGTLFFLDTTGMIFKHTGETWEPLSLRAKRPLTQMIVTAKGTWLATGDAGGIFRSTDKGFSWKVIDPGSKSDLEAVIEHRGLIIAIGDAGAVLISEDDGASFAPEKTSMTGHLWSLAAIDNTLVIGGEAGAIWRMVVETGTQPVAGVPFIPINL